MRPIRALKTNWIPNVSILSILYRVYMHIAHGSDRIDDDSAYMRNRDENEEEVIEENRKKKH